MSTFLKTKDILIGSSCVAISQLLYGVMEVTLKLSNLKITQIMAGRYATQLILACIWWNVNKPKQEKIHNWYGDKPYVGNIWLRGFIDSTIFTIFYATYKLPLGDMQCILYQSPLCVIFIARIWLKEELPKISILIPATILTYIGIILVAQPGFLLHIIDNTHTFEPLDTGGLIAILLSVLRWVFVVLLVRKARDSHFLQLEFASSTCCFCAALPILMIINEFTEINEIGNLDILDNNKWSFDIKSVFIMIFLGICGFGAVSLSVTGYQYGSATMVAWLEYINIPIGFIYQLYIFHDAPNRYEIIGGIMVTIACLLPTTHHLYIYLLTKYLQRYTLVSNISSDSDEYF
eukprot:209193_1